MALPELRSQLAPPPARGLENRPSQYNPLSFEYPMLRWFDAAAAPSTAGVQSHVKGVKLDAHSLSGSTHREDVATAGKPLLPRPSDLKTKRVDDKNAVSPWCRR